MAISKFSAELHEKMFPGYESKFLITDPEFIELFDNFAFDEVIQKTRLEENVRMMAILACLIGSQSIDEYNAMLPAAMNLGVTPIEVKEIVYQAVAYMGIGRTFPFLKSTNVIFESLGIQLPLQGQSTTNNDSRLENGIQAQVDIFGESMRNFYSSGDDDVKHINYWLTDNCFGDYYTRNGLNYKQREMITFCFLLAQGGCEPQLKSHVSGNIKLGNDKTFLIDVVSQCLPYIGYPRSLNGIRCIKDATAE